jgi:hypothetical protein
VNQSGTFTKLADACLPLSKGGAQSSPYLLAYTGLAPVDASLCSIVTLFQSVLDSPGRPFMVYFLYSFSYVSTIPSLEYERAQTLSLGLPLALFHPLLIGAFDQTLSVAFVTPIYSALLIYAGIAFAHHHDPPPTHFHPAGRVAHARAESMVVGLLLGYLLPTFLLLKYNNPYVTLAWQFVPLWTFLAQRLWYWLHVNLLPPWVQNETGHKYLRVLYTLLFLSSAIPHALYVGPLVFKHGLHAHTYIRALLLPSHLTPHPMSLSAGTLEFLKWDASLSFVSTIAGALWFVRDVTQLLKFAAWVVGATLLFGPGAAVAGIWFWRETTITNNETTKKD